MTARALKGARTLTVVGLSLAYFAYVFQLSSGEWRQAGLGDWIDPYFINYLLEHWYQSLLRLSSPASPTMFFPEPGTLGYSHGLILFAPFYVLVRPFFHPFQAEVAAMFLIMETGALALYWILRRFVALTFVESLLLTAFFVTSGNVVNGATGIWLQRASVFLIPPIVAIALWSARLAPGRSKLVLGGFAGFLATSLFTQDFYTAQFAVLVALVFLAGAFKVLRESFERAAREWGLAGQFTDTARPVRQDPGPSRAWLVVAGAALAWALFVWVHPMPRVTLGNWRVSAENYRRPLAVAAVAASWFALRRWRVRTRLGRFASRVSRVPYAFSVSLGAAAGIVVFAWIYVGVYLEGRTFPVEQLLNALTPIRPADWHGPMDVIRAIWAYDSPRSFWLAGLTAILAWLPWLRAPASHARYALWSVVVAALVLLLAVRIDRFSVWEILLGWIPGFSVIRDPKRIIYLWELGVTFVTALLLAGLPRRTPFRLAVPVLLACLIGVDWNREVFAYDRSNRVFKDWVEAPIAIDPSCRSFYIKTGSPAYMSRTNHMSTLYGIDSAFIALNHNLPTLNGYSAWEPKEWGLANPQESGYDESLERWIARHRLEGVCELDIDARRMTPSRKTAGILLQKP